MFYLPKVLRNRWVLFTVAVVLSVVLSVFLNGERAEAEIAKTETQSEELPTTVDWRQKIGTFRVGIVGGEHAVLRTKRAQPFRRALEEALGLPVEIFAAKNYQSLALAHAESRIEYAIYSATAFSLAWANCKCVEPLVVPRALDGTTAFRSVLISRPDVAKKLSDLKGSVIGVSGTGSFSGYKYPKQQLLTEGIDLGSRDWPLSVQPDSESIRQAFSKMDVDAFFGWRPHDYSPDDGPQRYNDARGTLFQLNQAGENYKIVWQSNPIPHGPHAVRKGLSMEARQMLVWFLDGLELRNPKAYDAIEPLMGGGFQPIMLDAFRPLIDAMQKPVKRTKAGLDVKAEKFASNITFSLGQLRR